MAVKTDAELRQAFESDGYAVRRTETFQGRRGWRAEHHTARNTRTGRPKQAFYVEGSGYEMGYLIGLLAEPDVRRMATDFTDSVVPAFISPELTGLGRKAAVQDLLTVVKVGCEAFYLLHPNDIPPALQDEMRGMADGCRATDPASPVTYQDLLTLNAGIDCLVAVAYTGLGLYERLEALLPKLSGLFPWFAKLRWLWPIIKLFLPTLKPENFRVPLACNAFAAFGNATADGRCYLGRDFQFPTAGVLQDTACLVVYNPSDSLPDGRPRLPLASQTAPGFVGSITAMNRLGVGLGVDMVPSGNCNPKRPGLNSLLMVRHAAHSGHGAQGAVDAMVAAQRGASWLYPVADGTNSRAYVVEAGMTTDEQNYLGYPPPELRPLLPTGPFQAWQRGLFVRGTDWRMPDGYLELNPALFQSFGATYDPAAFGERGALNPDWKHGIDRACFFAPQREQKPDLMVVTNHYLVPEMRLCAMKEWTDIVARDKMADILWRYDELNRRCLDAYGSIDFDRARELIDFLSPDRDFPEYYGRDHRVIEGSVTVCNLTDKVMSSHFGYHDDDWVGLTLPGYV